MRPAVLLVALAALLAGCTAETAPLQGADPAAGGGSSDGLPNATGQGGAAADGTAGNVSLGTAWVQAYWGADVQKTLLDAGGTVMNYATTGVITCPLQCTDVFFPLETPVAPGTERIEVTVRYARPGTAPGMVMDFAYRTAAEDSVTFMQVEPDTPVVIDVAPSDWDAPLQARSLWWFDLFPRTDGADHISDMEVSITVVAHRAAELPEFPEPADPWARGNTVVLQAGASRANQALRTPETNSCFDCEGFFWESDGTGLVGPGAGTITATLAWDWPGSTKPRLGYWNGVNVEGGFLELAEDGPTSRTFTLPVAPEEVDSPYQARSAWGFFATLETEGQPGGLVLGAMTLDASVARAA